MQVLILLLLLQPVKNIFETGQVDHLSRRMMLPICDAITITLKTEYSLLFLRHGLGQFVIVVAS